MRERLDKVINLTIQVTVYLSAIVLIAAGNLAHKHWKRTFEEDGSENL